MQYVYTGLVSRATLAPNAPSLPVVSDILNIYSCRFKIATRQGVSSTKLSTCNSILEGVLNLVGDMGTVPGYVHTSVPRVFLYTPWQALHEVRGFPI